MRMNILGAGQRMHLSKTQGYCELRGGIADGAMHSDTGVQIIGHLRHMRNIQTACV
jgi:hypothetical protein